MSGLSCFDWSFANMCKVARSMELRCGVKFHHFEGNIDESAEHAQGGSLSCRVIRRCESEREFWRFKPPERMSAPF